MEEQAVGVVTGEVYVSGALTAVQDGAPIRLFYEVLSEIVSDAGLRPYLPHRPDHHLIADAHLDARTAFDIKRAHVAAAAVLIAYAGLPSLGVGTEVEVVREHGVPVVIVVERDRPVSRILLGNPAVVEVVRSADLAGLRRDLGAALGRITRRPRSQRARVTDDQVVRRFFASLEGARRLPDSEVAALVRVAELDASRPRLSGVRSRKDDCSEQASATSSGATRCGGRSSRRSSCMTSSSFRSAQPPR